MAQQTAGKGGGDLFVPRPIGTVTEHLRDIQDAYLGFRPNCAPSQAFERALSAALDKEGRDDVSAFLAGELDSTFGAGQGAEFGRFLTDHLEELYDAQHANAERNRRREHMDIVDLAEDLATDATLVGAFCEALDREDVASAAHIVDQAAAFIVAKANQAWTNTGRKVKVEQAARVFLLLGKKASARPTSPAASGQAAWCGAVIEHLQPLYR